MGESNGGWGSLEHEESREIWDTFAALPEPGEHAVLDSFVAQKHITIAALRRLGTRIQGNTLAFAFPDALKFRDLDSGRRWAELGAQWRSLKIVPAGPTRAETVIIAEGETDAARLGLLFPSFDVAVLPGGARTWAPTFGAQLQPYDRILVALDNDAAGNAGAAIITEALGHAVRYAPPDGVKDWCALPEGAELPALPEPPRYGGLHVVDLATLMDEGVPEPEQIAEGMLYAEGVHWVSGHPGSGKTTIVLHAAALEMQQGRPVVWLDFESGDRRMARRLLAMGIPSTRVAERFVYAPWPQDPVTAITALVDELGQPPLVVFDSASKALARLGLNENENAEVTQWTGRLVQTAKELHLPIVVIDHVTKASSGRDGQYARGASSKLADSDVHWHVETIEKFKTDKIGRVRLKLKKDNDGSLFFLRIYEVGDGDYGLPVRLVLETDDEDDGLAVPGEDQGLPTL